MAAANPSAVERIKAASRGLRGTIVESLADPVTGGLAEDDQQLLKFHGTYQQHDRDSAEARRQAKLEPAYSFMIRTRLPGGLCMPAQWLALGPVPDHQVAHVGRAIAQQPQRAQHVGVALAADEVGDGHQRRRSF